MIPSSWKELVPRRPLHLRPRGARSISGLPIFPNKGIEAAGPEYLPSGGSGVCRWSGYGDHGASMKQLASSISLITRRFRARPSLNGAISIGTRGLTTIRSAVEKLNSSWRPQLEVEVQPSSFARYGARAACPSCR